VALLLALHGHGKNTLQHMLCTSERWLGHSCTSPALGAASRQGDEMQEHHKGILSWALLCCLDAALGQQKEHFEMVLT